MANPDQRTSCIAKLVSAARSVVTYQVGLPHGCTRIHGLLFMLHAPLLRTPEPLDYPVFDEYVKAIVELPCGTERLHWDRDALREFDVRLEAVNRAFRDRIFEACFDIIDTYATSYDRRPTGAKPRRSPEA